MDDKIYGYINAEGRHVNLAHRTFLGYNPIDVVEDDVDCPLEPIELQYFDSPQQAEWYFYSVLDRYLEFSDELHTLELVELEDSYIQSNHFKLVAGVND